MPTALLRRPQGAIELKSGQRVDRTFSGKTIVRAIDEAKRRIDFIISTERVDRYGDIVRLKGWELAEYRRNPIVLFGHNSRDLPIGKAVKVWKEDEALRATAEFAPEDVNPMGAMVFNLYRHGLLRAVSVGFIPKKWDYIVDEEDRFLGYEFVKQELIEFSCVPIPANPDALMDARKKGIDTGPMKDWIGGLLGDLSVKSEGAFRELYGIGRKDLENMAKTAAGKKVARLSPEEQDKLRQKNLKNVKEQAAAKNAAEEGGDDDTVDAVDLEDAIEALPEVTDAPEKSLVISEGEDGSIEAFEETPKDCIFARDQIDKALLGENKVFKLLMDGEGDDAVVQLLAEADGMTVIYNLTGKNAAGDLIGELKSVDEGSNELNFDAMSAAKRAIAGGLVSENGTVGEADLKRLARDSNWKAYGAAHLAIRSGTEEGSATHFKYAFMTSDGKVSKAALEHIVERAKLGDDTEVVNAAQRLIDLIDVKLAETKAAADEAAKPKEPAKQAAAAKPAAKTQGERNAPAEKKDEDDSIELSFEEQLGVLELGLANLEEAMDKDALAGATKMVQRKIKFLGTYMAELAQKIAGPEKKSKSISMAPTKAAKGADEDDDGEIDFEDADAVAKAVEEIAGPIIDEVLAAESARSRGRLD